METWRLLFTTGGLLLVWAVMVTLLGDPPGPVSIVGAAVFGLVGIYVSDLLIERYLKPYAEEES